MGLHVYIIGKTFLGKNVGANLINIKYIEIPIPILKSEGIIGIYICILVFYQRSTRAAKNYFFWHLEFMSFYHHLLLLEF